MGNKKIILGLVILLIGGAIFYFEAKKPERATNIAADIAPRIASMTKAEKAERYPLAKEIISPAGFVNTEPIKVADLIGAKVILVDFWTYSCINCQRTTPYLNAWYEKYQDQGLEILGIHTPEFEFEKKYENVLAAVKKLKIKYPVIQDNDYATWTAYQNRYWPRKYLIDIDGFIVYDHIGEGAYEETERKIQELLAERAIVLGTPETITTDVATPREAVSVNFSQVQSPEIYFGAARNEFLGHGVKQALGLQTLPEPAEINLNNLYLVGDWNFQREYAENQSSNAKIIFRYQAKAVYLVAAAQGRLKVTVLLDGQPISALSGADIKKTLNSSYFLVHEDRLYKIVEAEDYGEHTLELIIENPGLKAFTFTFG